MKFSRFFLVIFLAALSFAALSPVAAQEASDSEDDLFSDDAFSDDVFGDDMFSDDTMIEDLGELEDQIEGTGGQEAADSFLSTDSVEIGGSVRSSLGSTWSWADLPDSGNAFLEDGTDSLALDLSADLFLDARPANDFRFFAKVRTAYPFRSSVSALSGATLAGASLVTTETQISQLNLQVRELFTDIAIRDTVFLRFGKQTVNWGVGYFFSPADIISLTPIDVEDPQAEREGPIALKASLPLGLHNIDAYIIGDDTVRSLEDLGLAARTYLYLAPLSLELGAGYQKDRPLSLISTARVSVGDFSFFGEGRVNFGRLAQKIETDGSLADDDSAYFSGTAGLLYSNTDANVTAIAQYLYQGEGYNDTDLLDNAAAGVFAGTLPAEVAALFGRHHTVLSLGLSELFHEDLSANLLWQASWSDLSGLVSTSLSWQIFDRLSLSGGVHLGYGDRPSEFGGVELVPGSGDYLSLRNPYGRLGLSLTLGFGGGRF